MDQNLESKLELKNKIFNFYNLHKFKIYILITIFAISVFSLIFFKYNDERKNILLAEKYVEAGLNLASNKNESAKLLYEEIILSKNKFYSILALNVIIDKDLISDRNKILGYFKLLENSITDKDYNDLISLKKAIFLMKGPNIEKGKIYLKALVDSNSTLKSVAQELLEK
tara:strand:- start:755 stop:1264 length:510 start_codon:yes stop_codon:yes gene_type:complete